MSELPRKGDRVLVCFEATVKDTNATGPNWPVYVLEDGDVHGTWVHAKAVTVLPPPRSVGQPGMDEAAADLVSNHDETVVAAIERSPTAIELRLQDLENMAARHSLRLQKLEEDSTQHSRTLTALLPDRKWITELERLLGDLLRHLREV